MEKIFTLQQQKEQFALGKDYFLHGNYQLAEPILRLVIESALQHNDYSTYVSGTIWLNRLFINTSQFIQLQNMLTLVAPFIEKYASNEEYYFYHLHSIIFNSHYSIGDSVDDFEKLFKELSVTEHTMLYFVVGSNLIYTYLDHGLIDKGIALYEQLKPLSETYNFPNKMTLYMHTIYGFLLYYSKEEFATCAELIHLIETSDKIKIVDSFSYVYHICKAMNEAHTGDINKAKKSFEEILPKIDQLVHIRFELKLWIKTLEHFDLKEDLIFYQKLIIQMLEEQYTTEVKRLRKESIENNSRQFYEKQIYIDQLTNVKNRNFFEDILLKQQQVKNYTVAILDIDKFKLINDQFGHPVGDEAIKFIASHLANWTPRHDIHIIRYGGDEFIILMPYPITEMKTALSELHELILSTPFLVRKGEFVIPLSVSIGVSYTDQQYQTIQTLFEVADQTIYEAKKRRATLVIKPVTI